MGFLEQRDLSAVPCIPDYYKGKTLFVTGGSGFMGKVLIEKLLYSCTDLDRIYLLLRPKKGLTAAERLDVLYKNPCFDRLRTERPGVFESKVFFVAGDCSEIGLGISEEDRTLLINRVNIIFHVAASVRFDDPLKVAARLNLRGTKEILELAAETRHLEAFVHVSTSYSNTNREIIEEKLYPPPANWRDTLEICDELDNNTIQMITAKYMGEMPNTYVFTKQLAEQLVFEYKGKLPIVMTRPSIVISSDKEPIPGWLENFNGPVGLMLACGSGIMRCMYTDPDITHDYMPVDIAIQHLIAAAWIRGTKKLEATDDIPIYNCCNNEQAPASNRDLYEIGQSLVGEMPLRNTLWTIGVSFISNRRLYDLGVLFLHFLPALLVDILLTVLGKKPMLLKIQRRIYIASLAVEYFLKQQWTFNNENFLKLRSKIKPQDASQFCFDMKGIDRTEFLKNSWIVGKKYLLKENPADQEKARTHSKRLRLLDRMLKTAFYCFLIWKFVNSTYIQDIIRPI